MEDIRALTDESAVDDFRSWVVEHRGARIALDTETNGLWPWLADGIRHPTADRFEQEPFRCTHVAVAASDDGSAWVLDGSQRGLVRVALAQLEELGGKARVWAHNAEFDTLVLAHAFGVGLPMSDTVTLTRALRPSLPSYSLKALRPETEKAKDLLHEHFRALHPLDFTAPEQLKQVDAVLEEKLRPELEGQAAEAITSLAVSLVDGRKPPEWIAVRAEKLATASDPAVRKRAFKALVAAAPAGRRVAEAGRLLGEDRLRSELEDPDWLSQAFEVLPFDDEAGLYYVATDAIETARMVVELATEPPACITETHDRDTEEFRRAFYAARSSALVEVDVQRVYDRATARGHLIDLEMLEATEQQLADEKAASVQKWGIDLTSNSNDTRDWLAERGIVIRDRDGKETLSNKFYSKAEVPPGVEADWEEFRGLRDPEYGGIAAHTNFLTGIRKNLTVASDGSGRIHGWLTALGTDTGRTASSNPNLQNIQPSMRSMFLAEPGHLLVGADFDQVEPRVVAAMSGDEAMIEAVKGGDPYTALAVTIWGEQARKPAGREHETCGKCEACRLWAGFRKKAKVTLLAIQYGQGAPAMAADLGISEAEARRVRREFESGFPDLIRWSRQAIRSTEDGDYFTTGYGRPLPRPIDVSPGSPRTFTRAVNWRIQSTASDVFKRAVLTATEILGPESMWLPIHDELIVQVPDTTEWRVKALDGLREAMNFDFHGVPIQAEPECIGDRWYKLGSQPAAERLWKPSAPESLP